MLKSCRFKQFKFKFVKRFVKVLTLILLVNSIDIALAFADNTTDQYLRGITDYDCIYNESDFFIVNPSNDTSKPFLKIGIVVPFAFPHVLAASNLAISKINNDTSILSNFTLIPAYRDTGIKLEDSKLAVKSFVGFTNLVDDTSLLTSRVMVQCNKLPAIIIGPSIPLHLKTVSEIATSLLIPINFISAIVSDPLISNKADFPNVARLVPSDRSQAYALVQICLKFKWRRVAILYSTATEGTSIFNDFALFAQNANVELILAVSFDTVAMYNLNSNSSLPIDVSTQLDAIKQSSALIIILAFTNLEAASVFPQLYKANLHRSPYQLITINQVMRTESLFRANSGFAPVLLGLIGTRNAGFDAERFAKFTIDWNESYSRNMRFMYNVSKPLLVSRNAYDAVYLAAYALDTFQKIKIYCNHVDTTSTSYQIRQYKLDQDSCFAFQTMTDQQMLYKIIVSTTFIGITGLIELDENGDRKSFYDVVNVQQIGGLPVSIGMIKSTNISSAESIEIVMINSKPVWSDNRNMMPTDRLLTLERKILISNTSLYTTLVFCIGGLIFSIVLGVMNFIWRNTAIIKMGSAKFSSVIIVGVIETFILIMLTVIRNSSIMTNDSFFFKYCIADIWLSLTSFTMVFGCLFLKTYRIHRIFNSNVLANRKVISDKHLYFALLSLLLVDILLATLWTTIDTPKLEKNLTRSVMRDQNIINFYTYKCTSVFQNAWYFTAVIYKGLFLLYGAVLAIQIRGIKESAFNDSKWIAFCIYNIAIMMCVLIPINYAVDLSLESLVILRSIFLFFAAFLTLGLLFIPRFYSKIKADRTKQNLPF